jgi:excinuclease UvrABC nuclease subunit
MEPVAAEAVPLPRQQWLFAAPRPLAERLGRDFLSQVPHRPGVYVMSGRRPGSAESRVLYIGKSGDLRRRLADYWRVGPGSDSRKTIRLVQSVDTVTWETCRDEETALLRENELIRLHRPLFNRVNVWPAGYWYLGMIWKNPHLELRRQAEPGTQGYWCGAFKSLPVLGPLARLALTVANPGLNCVDFPLGRFSARSAGGERVALEMLTAIERESLIEELRGFAEGTSDRLLERLRAAIALRSDGPFFERVWREADLETLTQFYEHARRHWELRSYFGMQQQLIGKTVLDDLLVLFRRRQRDR